MVDGERPVTVNGLPVAARVVPAPETKPTGPYSTSKEVPVAVHAKVTVVVVDAVDEKAVGAIQVGPARILTSSIAKSPN